MCWFTLDKGPGRRMGLPRRQAVISLMAFPFCPFPLWGSSRDCFWMLDQATCQYSSFLRNYAPCQWWALGGPVCIIWLCTPGQVVDQSHLADTRGPTRFSFPPLEGELGNDKVSLCGQLTQNTYTWVLQHLMEEAGGGHQKKRRGKKTLWALVQHPLSSVQFCLRACEVPAIFIINSPLFFICLNQHTRYL